MALAQPEAIKNHAAFIWSVADLLRGDYSQSQYGQGILPLTVLRRLDCVLEPTKADVLKAAERLSGRVANVEPVLCQATGEQFFNTSPLDLHRLLDDRPRSLTTCAHTSRGSRHRRATSSNTSTSTPTSTGSTAPTCSTQ